MGEHERLSLASPNMCTVVAFQAHVARFFAERCFLRLNFFLGREAINEFISHVFCMYRYESYQRRLCTEAFVVILSVQLESCNIISSSPVMQLQVQACLPGACQVPGTLPLQNARGRAPGENALEDFS